MFSGANVQIIFHSASVVAIFLQIYFGALLAYVAYFWFRFFVSKITMC